MRRGESKPRVCRSVYATALRRASRPRMSGMGGSGCLPAMALMMSWGVTVGGGERKPGAVVAVAVVAPHGRERQLGRVAVNHDEESVDRGRFLVVLVVVHEGAHDARVAAALLVDLFEPVPAAFTAATPVVTVNVEFRAVVESDGAVVDAGDVAAPKEFRVEAGVAALVQRDFLGGHGNFSDAGELDVRR